ncbi:MAG: DUF362 domain-containing protein [Proteobacteria bacterium]|nr:DUF362 domain-containing protein [Pseudomonadota bacterium]
MSKTSNPRVLVFDASYDESMDRVVEDILKEFPFEWENKNVVVKPNLLSANPPEDGVTTHPSLVRAVVSSLLHRGAKVLVGDNPGVFGYGKSEEVARISGVEDAAKDCFIQLGRNPVKYNISARCIDHVIISKDILDADIVVNLPKLKTHSLTYFTGAIKNTFGYVVGGDKIRVHSQAKTPRLFSETLVDIFQIRPPELNIMDAVIAMEGNGPKNGTTRKLGKVLASNNAVSLDAAAAHLIGKKISAIPHIEIAGNRALGPINLSDISLNNPISPVSDFKMPTTFTSGIVGAILNRFLSRWINCVPKINKNRCEVCNICVDHCPVDAMKIENDYPKADNKKCINCYCCQEMCPEDAIMLKGRTINLIRGTSRNESA